MFAEYLFMQKVVVVGVGFFWRGGGESHLKAMLSI